MRDFKFLQPSKKERAFTDFMDALDDYHLGGIPLPTNRTVVQDTGLMRPFTLNVFAEPLGRIPTYLFAFEYSDLNTYETLRGTTIGQLTSGELGIPWCFTELLITREDNSFVSICYNNVREMDRRGLIFNPRDRVTICYKP